LQGGNGVAYSLHPTASATLSTGGGLSMSVTSKDIEMSLQVRALGWDAGVLVLV